MSPQGLVLCAVGLILVVLMLIGGLLKLLTNTKMIFFGYCATQLYRWLEKRRALAGPRHGWAAVLSGDFVAVGTECVVALVGDRELAAGATARWTLRLSRWNGQRAQAADGYAGRLAVALRRSGAAVPRGPRGETLPPLAVVDNEDGTLTLSCLLREAGDFVLAVTYDGVAAGASPFRLRWRAGELHPPSCSVRSGLGLVAPGVPTITQVDQPFELFFVPRDAFGNEIVGDEQLASLDLSVETSSEDGPYTFETSGGRNLTVRLFWPGSAHLAVKCRGVGIDAIDVCCLSAADVKRVDEMVAGGAGDRRIWFETVTVLARSGGATASLADEFASLARVCGNSKASVASWRGLIAAAKAQADFNPDPVHCKLNPRRIAVREYVRVPLIGVVMPIVKERLYSASVRAEMMFASCPADSSTFIIDDGSGDNVLVASSPDRDVLFGVFSSVYTSKLGGTASRRIESFDDKAAHFHLSLRKAAGRRPAGQRKLEVNRNDVLASLRCVSGSHWKHQFRTQFLNEPSVDLGGPSRELFKLASEVLLGFTDDAGVKAFEFTGGAAHPNHCAISAACLEHFELVGRFIGKCLLDTAFGEAGHLFAGRLSSALLKCLLDLPITVSDLQEDSPLRAQIDWIMSTPSIETASADVLGEALRFVDEEVTMIGTRRETQVHELRDGGRDLLVTDRNKRAFATSLARFRLGGRAHQQPCGRCTAQIARIVQGFSSIVEDEELLAMFDDRELELLVCGTPTVALEELRQHCVLDGWNGDEPTLVYLFGVVASFSDIERARFLQFVTVCVCVCCLVLCVLPRCCLLLPAALMVLLGLCAVCASAALRCVRC